MLSSSPEDYVGCHVTDIPHQMITPDKTMSSDAYLASFSRFLLYHDQRLWFIVNDLSFLKVHAPLQCLIFLYFCTYLSRLACVSVYYFLLFYVLYISFSIPTGPGVGGNFLSSCSIFTNFSFILMSSRPKTN